MKTAATLTVLGLLALSGRAIAQPASNIQGLFSIEFADEFADSALGSDWIAADGCSGSICRFPENISFNGIGLMHIDTLAADPGDGLPTPYTTGRIDTVQSFGPSYIEARFKATAASGISNAVFATSGGASFGPGQVFLTNPADFNNWTYSVGFEDFATVDVDFTFDSSDPFPGTSDLSDDPFHIYAVNYTEAGELIFSVDGTETVRYQVPDDADFSGVVNWAIGTAVGGQFGSVDGSVIGTSMSVDYFRVFTQNNIDLASDNFAYPGGSLGGGNQGSDFVGPWTVESGAVEVLAGNLSVPPALVLEPVAGDHLTLGSGDAITRDLTNDTRVNPGNGQDRFFLMQINKDDASELTVHFRRTSDDIVRWGFSVNADESVSALASDPANSSGPGVAPVGTDFFILSYFEATAGADNEQVYVKVFKDGDVIPTSIDSITWNAVDSVNTTTIMNAIDIASSSGSAEIDTIRLGNTLEEVLLETAVAAVAEDFDYPGETTLAGQNGGDGFGGAWAGAGTLSNDGLSLAYPTSPSTESRQGTGNHVALANGSAVREFSEAINLGRDDSNYVTALVNQSDLARLELHFEDTSGNARWRAGVENGNTVLGGIVSTDSVTISRADPGPAAADNRMRNTAGFAAIQRTFTPALYLNNESPDAQYFLAALIRKGPNSVVQFNFLDVNGNNRWSSLIDESGALATETFSNGAMSGPGIAPQSETFLMVANVDPAGADAGPSDISRITIFAEGDVLPSTFSDIEWDVQSTSGNSGAFLATLQVIVSGSVEIDEVRIVRENGGDIDDAILAVGNADMTDTIDYPAGSLAGSDGGSGWSTAYSTSLGLPALSVATGSLDFPEFEVGNFRNRTALLLSRIQTRPTDASTGDDEVRVKVFANGEVPPASEKDIDWDLVHTSPSAAFLRRLRIIGTSTGGTTAIDDIRTTTTYAQAIDAFCSLDLNADTDLDFLDILAELNLAEENSPGADFNGGGVDASDIIEFEAAVSTGDCN